MTRIGLDYLIHKENLRHNKAAEFETNRSNEAREIETKRANLVNEAETHRSNVARESETNRANIAKETETARSNVAKETETHRSNLAKEVETHRANTTAEGLKAQQLATDQQKIVVDAFSKFNTGLGAMAAADLRDGVPLNEMNQTLKQMQSLKKDVTQPKVPTELSDFAAKARLNLMAPVTLYRMARAEVAKRPIDMETGKFVDYSEISKGSPTVYNPRSNKIN